MAADTILHRLFAHAATRPHQAAYFSRNEEGWQGVTWREYALEVRAVAKALMALGVEAGSRVCILGHNRPEWVLMDLGCMAVGGAPAGIYATCSPEEVRYIVHHTEAPLVLLENEAQWEKVAREREHLPFLRHVVMMRGAKPIHDPLVLSWEEFIAKAAGARDSRLDERLQALEPSGLATLIYTSGTTGPPKGVMLSHQNLAWTGTQAAILVEGGPWDRTLSYLPLSHIAEQVFSIHAPITQGSAVYFARSTEKVPEDLKEVEPTLFFGVPRIWEKFHAAIAKKLDAATGAKKSTAAWARAIGRQASELRFEGREPRGALAAQYALAKRLVFDKLKKAVGLGKARMCVSGAAPIGREVLEFFASLDLPVYEVYGQSEDTGPTSMNLPGRMRLGTVGRRFPGVEVEIDRDGEILVRGPNVFLGYFKEPEATAETLAGGWLHTGDLGQFDAAGYLSITGRKKEILITAGGKNIAPKNIEEALRTHPPIADVVVVGDRRKYLTALITLDLEAARGIAAEEPTSAPHASRAVRDAVQRAVDQVNASLARVEQIKRFKLLPRAFSIEGGELTPTLKIKRSVVCENFATEIEAMYREEAAGPDAG